MKKALHIRKQLLKSVKYEEVYIKDYQAYRDATENVTYFSLYNNHQYHQSLAYRTPYKVHYESSSYN